jgi:hypothetical protein
MCSPHLELLGFIDEWASIKVDEIRTIIPHWILTHVSVRTRAMKGIRILFCFDLKNSIVKSCASFDDRACAT